MPTGSPGGGCVADVAEPPLLSPDGASGTTGGALRVDGGYVDAILP